MTPTRERALFILRCMLLALDCKPNWGPMETLESVTIDHGKRNGVTLEGIEKIKGMTVAEILKLPPETA